MIVVPEGTTFWWVRTEDEIAALHAKDAASGSVLDSAGEPKLYAGMGVGRVPATASAVVTRAVGAPWMHWIRKPSGLVECLLPIGNVSRLVCVQAHNCIHGT